MQHDFNRKLLYGKYIEVINMIKPDIDQLTLVLQSTHEYDFQDWINGLAEEIINEFLDKSSLLQLFDNWSDADVMLPEGYSKGYSFWNSPFYFCIAYHEAIAKMGIIIKFSAYAWHEYQKRYEKHFDKKIHLHSFFTMIDSSHYTFRLSRIDLCCDFINENINIDKLKRSIEEGRTEIRYGKY